MPFEKGHRKVGGRKPGTRNKASQLGHDLAQEIIGNRKYLRMLAKRLRDFDAPLHTEALLWQYAFGKPLDPNRTLHGEPEEELITPAAEDEEAEDDDDA